MDYTIHPKFLALSLELRCLPAARQNQFPLFVYQKSLEKQDPRVSIQL